MCCFHTYWLSLCVLRLISPLIFYQTIFLCPTIYILKSCKHISGFKLILLPKLQPHLAFWDWISAHQTSVLLIYILRLLQVLLTQTDPLKHHTLVHMNDIALSTKMWSVSNSSHYERSKCNYECVDMVILSPWQLDILTCRHDYSNTIITATFTHIFIPPQNTSLKNLLFHSFIHLFHIPLILYRCGTSHVYI